MSYSTSVNVACANRAAALAELWTRFTAMGWTLHDNMDGSSYRVYSSNGEASDRITEYIKVTWTTANVINFQPYGWWNNSTHAGSSANTTTSNNTTSETGCYLWIYGDKDLVYIMTKVGSTYYSSLFGHVKTRQNTLIATLTSGASSGSGVTLNVDSSTGFSAGSSYQIFSSVGEGRDWVAISSVPTGSSMVVTTLPRNYSAGAKIGICPSTFGLATVTSFAVTCPRDAVGTTNYGTYGAITQNAFYTTTSIDPDSALGAYVLVPFFFTGPDAAAHTTRSIGYHDGNILSSPSTSMVCEDTFGVGLLDSGTATSGAASTLTDSTKSWSVNVYQNKVVIITFGTGVGQIRKISSNTATELTVSVNWVTTPDATSQYKIYDEGYRYLVGTVVSLNTACREGV